MSKSKSSGTAKMATANLDQKETPFDPVPYETTDARTSITLLASSEKEIVIRALNVLAKYADKKDLNVVFLYKIGIVSKLLELVVYSDLTILRFSLKLLGLVVATVPEAAKELSLETYSSDIKQINHIYMTIDDPVIREFTSQFLSNAVKTEVMASSLLKMGTVVTIFNVLNTSQDPDTILNSLLHFNNILRAREAPLVVPHIVEFAPKIILCFLHNKIPEIRDMAMKVVETLVSWRSDDMQKLFKEEHLVETMFKIIFNDEYKPVHKRAFNVILTCTECLETATYFVRSLEFIQFCQWAKTCPKKYMLPSATVLTALTKQSELRQVLFDFSVEDAILSFFRTENENIFCKVCDSILNMSSHRYCCSKIVTPVVIECLVHMLHRSNIPIIPYHETALKTLRTLMKRDGRALNFIAACQGLEAITEALLRDQELHTDEGITILMDILYMFSSNNQYKEAVMNTSVYEMLLKRFDEPSEHSQKALVILNEYIDNPDCRQSFVEFDGPKIVIKKITTATKERELINVLLFLQRNFMYKKIGMAFLWKGGVQVLEQMSADIKEAVPILNRLLNMIYDLYLPLKFYKLGRLEITDHITSRFYAIKGPWNDDFPLLEIMEKQQAYPIREIYIVDFSADADELTKKKVPIPLRELSANRLPQKSSSVTKHRNQRSSILKANKSPRTSKSSDISEPLMLSFMTCRIPPPINFGYISQDPYLPQHVEKLKSLLYHDKKYILCFQHQVKLVASFVSDILSGPEEACSDATKKHCLEIHLATVREKLGTSLIPLGFLRYGFHMERALLFKALAEKVGIPASLVKGNVKGKNNLLYWNEVPIATEEPYVNVDDEQKTFLAYAVVDLMDEVGNLMLVGSLEANKYCGLD